MVLQWGSIGIYNRGYYSSTLGAFQLRKTKPQAMAWGFVSLLNNDHNQSVSDGAESIGVIY
ncbi:MAG: hypothetical protein DYG89_15825 [Caldilinea sp. CFX5]|nr:hypothetical protein [Caldilinea sp. CFX5]